MIRFSKLRLQGFKSFVQPTELPIDQGLTAIVGPNGCGKSNLVEALRWAMGETSAKRMRGSGMADVIFAGTEKRPARNFAEVVITLDNSERSATQAFNQFDELGISRKIDRDKGSIYRVNGKEVRARDVQLLFTDSATGSGSTSLVGQGKLNAIITAKPAERRMLLEEAAGIGGLRSRRHEALLRLKNSEANLERLDEVLVGLGSRRRELLKQGRQAEQYKELSTQISRLEVEIAALDWIDQSIVLDQAKQELTQAQEALAAAEALLAQSNASFASQEEQLEPLRKAETQAAAALQHARLEGERAKSEIARLNAQEDAAKQAQSQLGEDLKRETAILEQARKTLAILSEERETLARDEKETGPSIEQLDGKVRNLAIAMNAADQKLQDLRQKRAALVSEQESLQRQISRAQGDVGSREQRLNSQVQEIDQIKQGLAAQTALVNAEASVGHAQEAFDASGLDIDEFEAQIEALHLEEQCKRQARTEASQALAALQSELTSLERALAHADRQSSGEAALALKISAPEGLVQAVAAVMGAASSFAEQREAAGWRDLEAISLEALSLEAPAGFEALSRLVTVPVALKRRFQGVGLAQDKDSALSAQDGLRVGQALVTSDGWLIAWDGLVNDPAGLDLSLAQRLRQQERLAQLKPLIEPAEDANQSALEAHQTAQSSLKTKEQLLKEARNQRQQASVVLRQAEQAFEKLKRGTEEQSRRLAGLEAQHVQGQEDLLTAQAVLTDLEASMAALADRKFLEQDIHTAEDQLNQVRSSVGQGRSQLDAQRQASLKRQERLTAVQREDQLWRDRAEKAEQTLAQFEQRNAGLSTQIQAFGADSSTWLEHRDTAGLQEQRAEAQHQTASSTLKDAEASIDGLKRALKAAEATASDAKGQLIRCETLSGTARQARQDLRARISENLGRLPEAVIAEANFNLDQPQSLPNREDQARHLEQAKARRAALGAVNLRAALEAEELETNSDSYREEKAELEEAISKLRKTISTLNKEARGRVLDAFETINAKFKELFVELFGGGKANLELIESDDPLEAGLEVFAQPPGKKLQALSLLSGGEQTMSAIALLFSVFQANPAPICVLDEVDAPLDEANVDRFCKMVRRMAGLTGTRFLVVTHHPVTMARANRLFGVTMQEQGVSTLVTLDLSEAEAIAEAG